MNSRHIWEKKDERFREVLKWAKKNINTRSSKTDQEEQITRHVITTHGFLRRTAKTYADAIIIILNDPTAMAKWMKDNGGNSE